MFDVKNFYKTKHKNVKYNIHSTKNMYNTTTIKTKLNGQQIKCMIKKKKSNVLNKNKIITQKISPCLHKAKIHKIQKAEKKFTK